MSIWLGNKAISCLIPIDYVYIAEIQYSQGSAFISKVGNVPAGSDR